MIALGLLIAGATGAGAFLGGKPFLTSGYDYFHWPVVGEVELATAALFDLGVFFTVLGGVMLALAAIARLTRGEIFARTAQDHIPGACPGKDVIPRAALQSYRRIHRIGQKHVCRLWNLVADETREGQVFTRLLEKMEAQRAAYGGRLFDVLGEAFKDQPLSKLLMEAVRYGDDPARQAELERVLDAEVSRGTEDLLRERALARESLTPHQLSMLRRQMDEGGSPVSVDT